MKAECKPEEDVIFQVSYARLLARMTSEQERLNHWLQEEIVIEEEESFASIPLTITSVITSAEIKNIIREEVVIFLWKAKKELVSGHDGLEYEKG